MASGMSCPRSCGCWQWPERSPVPRRQSVVLGAAALSASVFTQPSAPLIAVILAAISARVFINRSANARDLAVAAATALAVLSPLALWFLRYPSSYGDTFGGWFLHPAHIRNPVDFVVSLTNPNTLAAFGFTYWDFFSPSHLFMSESAPFAGVFLTPMAPLLGIGVIEVVRASSQTAAPEHDTRTSGVGTVVLLSMVCLPMAAATFKNPRVIKRALAIAPLGALLAAYGLRALWRRRE
jgi:hypothetical protein